MSAVSLVISIFSFMASAVSLGVVLYDRRAKLLYRLREGKWIELGRMIEHEPTLREVPILRGVVEIYNRSTRPNTVSSYRYMARNTRGQWVKLQSERFDMKTDRVYNATPLVIPPYTGMEVGISCIIAPEDLLEIVEITATIVDVFDTPYTFPVWMRDEEAPTTATHI